MLLPRLLLFLALNFEFSYSFTTAPSPLRQHLSFTSRHRHGRPPSSKNILVNNPVPPSCQSPRISHTTRTQLNLFGLGVGEVVIVVLGIGVVLGPEKITQFIRSSASSAGEFQSELSKVPEEFQKGVEEGEIEARSRKAKRIKVSSDVKETERTGGANEKEDEA